MLGQPTSPQRYQHLFILDADHLRLQIEKLLTNLSAESQSPRRKADWDFLDDSSPRSDRAVSRFCCIAAHISRRLEAVSISGLAKHIPLSRWKVARQLQERNSTYSSLRYRYLHLQQSAENSSRLWLQAYAISSFINTVKSQSWTTGNRRTIDTEL